MAGVLLQGFNDLLFFVYLAMLVMAIFCLVDALLRRDDAFVAADKKTKSFWLIIMGVTVAVHLFIPFFFLKIIGLIASIVYIVDVRPALIQVGGGPAGGRRGSSSDGPYGPYNGGR